MERTAWLICDSGWDGERYIGQGHLSRCQALGLHLQRLGWNVQLWEFHLSPTPQGSASKPVFSEISSQEDPGQVPHHCADFSLAQLQGLACLPLAIKKEIRGDMQRNSGVSLPPKLLIIDSYQLPMAFYQACTAQIPVCHFLAVDDFDRLDYPKEFFVLQASLSPLRPKAHKTHKLRGLSYQVLRPEFYSTAVLDSFAPQPYTLLVPGSAFSLAQLESAAAALRRRSPSPGQDLVLLLSPRQRSTVAQLPAGQIPNWPAKTLSDLSTAELLPLYSGAAQIFCAAGQSLLEVLALPGPYPRGVCALLCADNQEPLLRQLPGLPFIDMRPALAGTIPLAQLLQNYREPPSDPVSDARLSAKQEKSVLAARLQQLRDGRGMERILRKIGLSALASRSMSCDN